METVAFRTCPFCEATCGLEVTLDDGEVTRVRGDAEDVFSKGFLCPKGVSLKELHDDPDRLRGPVARQPDGSFAPISWDDAFALIEERLTPILAEHGRDSVAAYLGNPFAHGMAGLLYGRILLKALGTKNVYSASTVDQYPKQMSSALLFGTSTSIAIPDIDRTDHMLILGANPLASNGSLMTAPDFRGRLKALQARGGRIVVVDPRRSRTAQMADEHVPIRPGSDALLLMAMVGVLFDEDLVALGTVAEHVSGVEAVGELAAEFTPEAVAGPTGIDAETIRRMTRELAAAERAVVYGRIGTTTQEFGTLASWLVDVLNVLTGNLDREGGAMFPLAATGLPNSKGAPGRGRGSIFGRWSTRVRGLGEVFGELPVSCLAEEIDTPGEGQVRALFTLAGNPAVSTPNSERLCAGLEQLEFMVSLDIYVTETSKHADVILPGPSPLEKSNYDLVFYGFGVRNIANYSAPALPAPDGLTPEWRTLVRLAGIASGQGPDADVDTIDRVVAAEVLRRETVSEHSAVHGREAEELMALVVDPATGEPRTGPERLLDIMLRTGPYGDGFGADPDGLTLAALEAEPHGIDLGPLKPRVPEVLRTPSGTIELDHAVLAGDVPRLRAVLDRDAGTMVLVGRRDLRSNNSWMHNLPLLVRGAVRCTAHVHPDDAARLALDDGSEVVVRSRVGEIRVPVEVTDDIMPGVVSIPHGWGHDVEHVGWRTAAKAGGVNSNVLTDDLLVDALSGNAVLNGIPVSLAPVREAVAAD